MRKPRIYLETTVFNHYFDVDREAHAATCSERVYSAATVCPAAPQCGPSI